MEPDQRMAAPVQAPVQARDVTIAEAARALAEACRTANEAIRRFIDAWEMRP